MSHPTSDARVGALSNVPPAQAPAGAAAGFDYAALRPADAEDLRDRAGRLRGLFKKHTADIVVIGRDLIAVKDRLAHGQFESWIERELGVGIRAAQYYMTVAKFTEGKSEHVALLPPGTLRLLAAKSAPAEIVEQVIARAASGDIVPDDTVAAMIRTDRMEKKSQADREAEAAKRRSKGGRAARTRKAALGSNIVTCNGKRTEAQPITTEPVIDAEPVVKRVGTSHHELTNLLDGYCGRLEAFVENHPDLDDECRRCLMQALELNADRLQRLAQHLHSR
ncbi:hypothetical protein [Bradyrhizobium erythrophlei]|uniref:DUF3102 domain-containing protein n=1 Tax=Bradyrhizobium erythrophlei TaxID=1437360 RepID=A0A1M5QHC1_9BRAD|nr:hypothetical protein [Bradyrhizobium erythrophlei]SHH13210.1 hypothetical protein SAMN05443248_3802 [Bradyrhizobium erythrophlei]